MEPSHKSGYVCILFYNIFWLDLSPSPVRAQESCPAPFCFVVLILLQVPNHFLSINNTKVLFSGLQTVRWSSYPVNISPRKYQQRELNRENTRVTQTILLCEWWMNQITGILSINQSTIFTASYWIFIIIDSNRLESIAINYYGWLRYFSGVPREYYGGPSFVGHVAT